MKNKKISITKYSGDKDLFDESKLRHSLIRSGAKDDIIKRITDEIKTSLYDGISTKEIYKMAFSFLRKSSRPTAARYKLKKAIYELGPSGFPFEKFIAEILKHEGFQTQINIIVKGHCVNHEIDVIAEKNDKHFMIECKFHNTQGMLCNVKIPLYISSRFHDVERVWQKQAGHNGKFHQGWIFTNTRFTTDAIQYGTCAGLMLIGWNHPKKDSLKERIDASGLHPVTCLTTLTKYEKTKLLDKNIVLCMSLCNNHQVLKLIGVSNQRINKVLNEAYELCNL